MDSYSPFGVLPTELYIMILNYLNYPDETGKAPIAIFRLALSSRSLYNFISYCVSKLPNTSQEYEKINSLQLHYPPPGYPRSILAVYCKRLAGICALCTLRAYILEHFSQLQLCHACDLKYFLKISKGRLESCYTVAPRKRVNRRHLKKELAYVKIPYEDNGEYRTGTWYLWADIQRMKSKGYLRPSKYSREIASRFKYEDYTYQMGSGPVGYCHLFWYRSLVSYAALSWCKSRLIDASIGIFGQLPVPRRPLVMEAAHFIEFRYRFDPNWQPPGRESLMEFIRIISPWANENYWCLRPWRNSNFPRHPRSLVINNCGISIQEKKRVEHDTKMYQYRCSKIRAVLKAFPEILLSPKIWQKCMLDHRGLPIDHVRSMAHEASLTWTGYTPADMEFGIARWGSGEGDWQPRVFHPHSADWINSSRRFGVDIVRIEHGSMEVEPPIRQEDLEWRKYHI